MLITLFGYQPKRSSQAARSHERERQKSELPSYFADTTLELTYVSTERVPGDIRCATMGEVKQAPYRTVTRRWDEPRLEIGDTISIAEGLIGVVLARYMRSGDAGNHVHYIVELRREAEQH
jgi:hypothetical protein